MRFDAGGVVGVAGVVGVTAGRGCAVLVATLLDVSSFCKRSMLLAKTLIV